METVKYSTIKKEVYNDMQRVYALTPLKVIKACTTRWLTHDKACWRIILRFEPLVDLLDAVYNEKRCLDVKRVRDALLQPQNICMGLLVGELLVPINYFSNFLQTSLNYSSIKNKLGSVIERSKLIQEGQEDYDAIDSSLVHFHKVVKFLTISVERMELAHPLCNRVLLIVDEIKVKVKACVRYSILSPNDSPLKTLKCFLFHLKSSFRSRDIQIFVIFYLPFNTFQIQKDK